MWQICLKEWRQFFSSLSGYIAIIFFLLLNGLFLFVFPDTSILENGYASLSEYFTIAPWILLFLIPTLTMKTLSDEYQSGSFEILKTFPIKSSAIAWGKFWGAFFIFLLALLPTVIYAVSLNKLSATGGIDVGSTAGSYVGLLFLGAIYCAIGIAVSSCTNNAIIAFIMTALICLLLYKGLDAIASLSFWGNSARYYLELLGINSHYKNSSKGVLAFSDIAYYLIVIIAAISIANKKIKDRI